jgi:hypothetical protein
MACISAALPDGDVACTELFDDLYVHAQHTGFPVLVSGTMAPLLEVQLDYLELCDWCDGTKQVCVRMACQLCTSDQLAMCTVCLGRACGDAPSAWYNRSVLRDVKSLDLMQLALAGCQKCRVAATVAAAANRQ